MVEEDRLQELEQKELRKAQKRQLREEKRLRIKEKNEPPHLTILEEIGNAVSHGVGALLAAIGMVMLLIKSNTGLEIMGALFYGISLFFLMLMSCLYHAFRSGSKVKRLWRRFDYSSIYLLIGGTFAPFYLVYMGNTLGIVLFCVQWGLITLGITMVAVFGPGRLQWLHFPLYFTIGWSGLMFMPDWYRNSQPLFWLILIGGVIYTVGMIPFSRDKKHDHFIWHFFVLGGAILHWIGIYLYVYLVV